MLSVILLIITGLYLVHKYISSNFDYWKKRNISYIEPKPVVGNLLDVVLLRKSQHDFFLELHQNPNPYFGIFLFGKPALILTDQELIKNVTIKDFEHFQNHALFNNPYDIFSKNFLVCLENAEWKEMRQRTSKFFTGVKIKQSFGLMNNVGDILVEYLNHKNQVPVDPKILGEQFMATILASYCLGVEINSLCDEKTEMYEKTQLLFDYGVTNLSRFTMYYFFPKVAKMFGVHMYRPQVTFYYRSLFLKAFNDRRKTGAKRNDFIDFMLESINDKELEAILKCEGDKWTSQAIFLFIAGMETTSTNIGFLLYELAINQDIQEKLYAEIKEKLELHKGFNYEFIMDLPYLQMAVQETLRRYPTLPMLDRICNKNYQIPGTQHVIEKGTPIYFSTKGVNYNSKLFPEPDKFIPERFQDPSSVPSEFMPFGNGPRQCVAYRFGYVGAKVALTRLLSEFKVERTPECPDVIEFAKNTVTVHPVKPIYVQFRKRSAN